MSLFIKRILNWIFQIMAQFPILKKMLDKLMYNRIYKFFNKNNLIHPFQFGFRQQYFIFQALISLTKDIRKNIDKGNIDCGWYFL